MTSDKFLAQQTIVLLKNLEVSLVFIAPGSRSAPLVLSIEGHGFACYTFFDERSLGFIALGASKALNKPVAIISTSGSALMNIGASLLEASYQKIPLIYLSADRPKSLINKGMNQTFNQPNLFSNFISHSFHIEDTSENQEIISLFSKIHQSFRDLGAKSPIHLNLGFSEPLYNTINIKSEELSTDLHQLSKSKQIANCLNCSYVALNKPTIVFIYESRLIDWCELNVDFEKLAQNHVYLVSEVGVHISSPLVNPYADEFFRSLYRLDEHIDFQLISIGEIALSKHFGLVRQRFFNAKHIDFSLNLRDYSLNMHYSNHLYSELPDLFDFLMSYSFPKFDNFHLETSENLSKEYLMIEEVLDYIEEGSMVFLGNSSVVRYVAQSKLIQKNISFYMNRGVSGIDGELATAIGMSIALSRRIYVIIGDISFLYELNSLMITQYIQIELTIFVLNNQGGKIFQKVGSYPEALASYFETPHHINFQDIANLYQASYFKATLSELKTKLSELKKTNNPICLFELKSS
jgi:2-succinyl-5-enolpyruvyl-6-hydroxy-3-cyclohexene-1-carboxylate synthase